MRRIGALIWVLAAASACGGSSAASPGPRSVTLAIHYSRFSPESFSLAAGTTVRIAVHNSDPIDHELIVGDQAIQDLHERGRHAHHDGAVPGEVSVPAGATVLTSYRFERPGQYLFGCHLPGHWAYGMRGVVEVGPAPY